MHDSQWIEGRNGLKERITGAGHNSDAEIKELLTKRALIRDREAHPFTRLLVEGKLTPRQLRGWAVNWFYFENCMPRKDAAIISNCDVQSVRRLWVLKVLEHDGYGSTPGAIEGWLKFSESLGLRREEVTHARFLEGVVKAVDDYVAFAKSRSWIEGIATSIGMLSVPRLVALRLEALEKKYPWIDRGGLGYFRSLYVKAGRDGRAALQIVSAYCQSEEDRKGALLAVEFGIQVQRRILDSIYSEYVLKNAKI
jgi:pyrroloquinoline-quinone synthase